MTREQAHRFLTLMANDLWNDVVTRDTLMEIATCICNDLFEPCPDDVKENGFCPSCTHQERFEGESFEDPQLSPGDPDNCLGNGKHEGYECCCDECDYYLDCTPELDTSTDIVP